jgi:hypothetical protein
MNKKIWTILRLHFFPRQDDSETGLGYGKKLNKKSERILKRKYHSLRFVFQIKENVYLQSKSK